MKGRPVFVIHEIADLWNEKEIFPNWLARTLVILLPVIFVLTILLIVLAVAAVLGGG